MANSRLRRSALYLLRHIRMLCIGAMLIIMLPSITTSVLVNRGNMLLAQGLMRSESTIGKYPHWMINPESNHSRQALRTFELAAQLDPSDFTVRWGYGRAALANGMAEEAARVLPADVSCLRANPLCFLDVVVANSRAGYDDKVLELSSDVPNQITGRVISDTVALVFLNRARAMTESDLEVASSDLRQVASLRPFDLYANYHLWRHAIQIGNAEEAMDYRQRLLHFLSDAVVMDDERLLNYVLEIFPLLLSANLWGPEGGQNTMSYWVWRHPESTALKHLLEELTQRFPEQAYWHFYLGELHHRLGNLDLAKRDYETVIRLDPDDRRARTHLGQSHQESVLDRSTEADALLQDGRLTAELFGVPNSEVQLGTNLFRGDSFTSESGPSDGWFYEMAGGVHNWQFATGRDSLERPGSLRFVNLWWPRSDRDSGYIPYADYHSSEFIVPTPWLMVSLWYKVEGGAADHGFMYVGTLSTPGHAPFFVSTQLADTAGQWKRLVAVGPTPQPNSELFLTVGDADAANVWFQDILVRPVELASAPSNCVQATCVSLDNP